MSSRIQLNTVDAVFGYVRQNCIHSVPKAITRICVLYFKECTKILWRGKRLRNLLSSQCNEVFQERIKITPDITITIWIAPNGINNKVNKREGQFCVGIVLKSCSIAKSVDYFDDNTIDMEVIIHSFKIKYKDNGEILCYPSLNAYQLKRVTEFKWNVDKTMIDKFKNWPNDIAKYGSPVIDNSSVVCKPNG